MANTKLHINRDLTNAAILALTGQDERTWFLPTDADTPYFVNNVGVPTLLTAGTVNVYNADGTTTGTRAVTLGSGFDFTIGNSGGDKPFHITEPTGDVGINTGAPNSKLEISGSISKKLVTEITTTRTAGNEYTILCDDDTAGGVITVTLPAASGKSGRIYVIKKIGSTANIVIDGNASETIDGALTATLTTQWESITIQTNGSNWFII